LVAHILGWIILPVNAGRGISIRIILCKVAEVWSWFPLWFASVVRAEQTPLAPDVEKNSFHLTMFFQAPFAPKALKLCPDAHSHLDSYLPGFVESYSNMKNSVLEVMLTMLAPCVPNESMFDDVPRGVRVDGTFLTCLPKDFLILQLSSWW
jgi:hypothetical protein